MRKNGIKLLSAIIGLFLALQCYAAKAPKYVFLFIGDGMGVNQVNLTEIYLGAANGRMEPEPLCFSQFPVAGLATTYCYDNFITDSAASATAIATGTKTYKIGLGLDPERKPLVNIAEMARRSGKKVAIMTTDNVNGATPSAFYSHQLNRGKCDQILKDIPASGFDFFAGAAYQRNAPDRRHFPDTREAIDEFLTSSGCTVARSKEECLAAAGTASRIVFVPDSSHTVTKRMEVDYRRSIDPRQQFTTLKDMLECSLDFLMKDGCKDGFFLMAEGGLIDSQCHGNDAASVIREIQDFNEAVEYAYNFYLKHPKETAIVVTADHETGGIVIASYLKEEITRLGCQKVPTYMMTEMLKKEMDANGGTLSWEQTKAFLAEYTGLWKEVELGEEEENILRSCYENTIARSETGHVTDEYGYSDNAVLVERAVRMLDELSEVYWLSYSHTSGYVPVFAVGPGTGIFSSKNDNTDICKKLLTLTKYK